MAPKRRKKKKLRIPIPWLYRLLSKEPGPKKIRHGGRKLKLKKEVYFAAAGILAVLALIFVPRAVTSGKLKKLGYDRETITAIRKQKLSKTLLDNSYYSDYLASCIKADSLNLSYLPYYTVVSQERGLDATDFLLINRLEDKGYTEDQIRNLLHSLKRREIIPLLVFDYQFDEKPYIQDCKDHAEENNENNFNLSGNYYTFYQNGRQVEDVTSDTMLVNKSTYLDASYTPVNLTELSIRYAATDRYLAGSAAEALAVWGQAGANVGVTFYATSAYRTYENQQTLYNNYVNAKGQEEADFYSARPGYSEHQTGLAVDIAATHEDNIKEFKDTLAYQWTSTNSADYGWILRYPEGKKVITGYDFESWHYRYVGVEVAKAVVASNLTYDEFYSLYLKTWDKEEHKPADDILEASSWKHLTESNEEPK